MREMPHNKTYPISVIVLATIALIVSCTLDTPESAQNNGILFETSAASTKGSVTTTAGLCTNGNAFLVDAFLEEANRPSMNDETPHYIQSKSFIYSASKSRWTSTCLWVDRVYTNFWARYPSSAPAPVFRGDGASDGRQRSCTVNYSMPSSTGVTQYARDCCQDLVYAYARKRTNLNATTPDLTVKAQFRHILSAVCFEAGELGASMDISKITINGIFTSGTCSLVGCPSEDDDNIGDTFSFSWSSLSAKDTNGLSQSLEKGELAGGALKPGGDKVFFLIPQIIPSDASVTVTFVSGKRSFDATVPIGDSDVRWEAGGCYTYRISFRGDLFTIKMIESSVDSWDEVAGELDATK